MFGFFKKKRPRHTEETPVNWSFLGTDIHSHFIPGIDDGPREPEESLSLLEEMQRNGFSRIVTTPHISADYYPNTRDRILKGLEQLQEAALKRSITLNIEAAAEYMIDEKFMAMLAAREPLLSFGNSRYVLVEMGFVQAAPMLQQAIFELQALGYHPVLAHPERYRYYHATAADELAVLKHNGCLLQLNTIALTGYYGKDVNICANKLLKEGLYDFSGSDIHHKRHLHAFNAALRNDIQGLLKTASFLNNSL